MRAGFVQISRYWVAAGFSQFSISITKPFHHACAKQGQIKHSEHYQCPFLVIRRFKSAIIYLEVQNSPYHAQGCPTP